MEKLKSITIEDNEKWLRQVSTSVNIGTDQDLKDNIKTLEEYCMGNEVMAMAAIQLGIPKRLVYLKNTNLDIINKMQTDSTTEEEQSYNESRVLINPVVLNREGLTEYWEACASCLDNCGRVYRPYKIDLEYYDIDGEKHLEVFEGFESTVLSHELDHLDGVLHMDVAEEVIKLPKEERKKWRQEHGYKIYHELGDYDKIKKEEKGKNKVIKK